MPAQGAGERALAALAEDPNSIPQTHIFPDWLELQFQGMPSSGLYGHCMTQVHIYTCRPNTQAHKNFKKIQSLTSHSLWDWNFVCGLK